MTINNSLNWFEIPVADFERARKFYGTLYDFEMPSVPMGDTMMGFFPVEPGHIGGAIVKFDGSTPSQDGSLIYLNGGDDLDVILQRVPGAGGKILMEKTAISDEHGFYATFLDTEGNRVALHSMA